jgi:hypothetical protein
VVVERLEEYMAETIARHRRAVIIKQFMKLRLSKRMKTASINAFHANEGTYLIFRRHLRLYIPVEVQKPGHRVSHISEDGRWQHAG